MKYVAGIDIGSLTAKIVVLSVNHKSVNIAHSKIKRVGYNPSKTSNILIDEAINLLNIQIFESLIATGYGRKLVLRATKAMTEITCHAKGAFFVNPDIRTVIDIGGQDSKVIRLNGRGNVQEFELNDKCSAGTGRFLEVMANALEVDNLSLFGKMALDSVKPTPISSTCTVFAESEVISRLNQGAQRNDIIAGIHKTIASKIAALASRVGIEPIIALTGGVALNLGVKFMLEKQIKTSIEVPPDPQLMGALGAALIAAQQVKEI